MNLIPRFLVVALSGLAFNASGAEITPLINAHSHNDYVHARPLVEALELGFGSVEADIHLVEGRLLVAHDKIATRPDRTLESMYLDPLRERVNRNGGWVYTPGTSLTLLVDVKSGAESTWKALRLVLEKYTDMVTSFAPGRIEVKAITVIVSGNRARELMKADQPCLAFYDGRMEDLESGESKEFIPLVSDNWAKYFKWRGTGELPVVERAKLRQFVDKAHAQGRRIRFWGAPDTEPVWGEFHAAGVDLLNADHLPELAVFLRRPPSKSAGAPQAGQ